MKLSGKPIGFTLTELLIVQLIIGILVAITIRTYIFSQTGMSRSRTLRDLSVRVFATGGLRHSSIEVLHQIYHLPAIDFLPGDLRLLHLLQHLGSVIPHGLGHKYGGDPAPQLREIGLLSFSMA